LELKSRREGKRCWVDEQRQVERVTACGHVPCGAILTACHCGAKSSTPEDSIRRNQGLLRKRKSAVLGADSA
jgi:hypothetical protein